jgi:hypothetical protein
MSPNSPHSNLSLDRYDSETTAKLNNDNMEEDHVDDEISMHLICRGLHELQFVLSV